MRQLECSPFGGAPVEEKRPHAKPPRGAPRGGRCSRQLVAQSELELLELDELLLEIELELLLDELEEIELDELLEMELDELEEMELEELDETELEELLETELELDELPRLESELEELDPSVGSGEFASSQPERPAMPNTAAPESRSRKSRREAPLVGRSGASSFIRGSFESLSGIEWLHPVGRTSHPYDMRRVPQSENAPSVHYTCLTPQVVTSNSR